MHAQVGGAKKYPEVPTWEGGSMEKYGREGGSVGKSGRMGGDSDKGSSGYVSAPGWEGGSRGDGSSYSEEGYARGQGAAGGAGGLKLGVSGVGSFEGSLNTAQLGMKEVGGAAAGRVQHIHTRMLGTVGMPGRSNVALATGGPYRLVGQGR